MRTRLLRVATVVVAVTSCLALGSRVQGRPEVSPPMHSSLRFSSEGNAKGERQEVRLSSRRSPGAALCATSSAQIGDVADLLFYPTSRVAQVGEIFTFDLMIATRTLINGVRLHIGFDPAVLHVVDQSGAPATAIEPDLPHGWVCYGNTADNLSGTIYFNAWTAGWLLYDETFSVATVRFKKMAASAATTVRYVAPSAVELRPIDYEATLGSADVVGAPPALDTSPPRIIIWAQTPDDHRISRDFCPGAILLEIDTGVTDVGSGLDWVRLYHDIDGQPQPVLQLDLNGEKSAPFFEVLGPFPRAATVRYYLRARDIAGNESRDPGEGSAPYVLTVSDCPGCTSWRVGFSPGSNGLRFTNIGRNLCAGMAAAAIDYFESHAAIPPEYNLWDVSPSNPLLCYVKRRHTRVNASTIPYTLGQVLQYGPVPFFRNLNEYQKIRSQIKDVGRVALIGLGFTKGHAVTAYACTECTDGRVALLVYDPNKVAAIGGAFPGVINGRFSGSGLIVDSTSTGAYREIFADFTAPLLSLPQYPNLAACSASDIDRAMSEVTASGYLADSRSVVESTLVAGQSTPDYPFWNDHTASTAVFATWTSGRLNLSVFRPNGSVFSQAQGSQSPLIIRIPAGQQDGLWSYRITLLLSSREAEGQALASSSCISVIGFQRFDSYLPVVLEAPSP